MNMLKTAAIGMALTAGAAFADGHATGDVAAGESVFKKCKSCHSIVSTKGETIAKGGKSAPNLYGVYTRVAGSEEEFSTNFGKSMMEAGENGLTWNEADFVKYVGNPRDFLKEYNDDKKAKAKMSFRLKDEVDAKNVWAYLVSVGPEGEAAASN